jgi:hypothetical protein
MRRAARVDASQSEIVAALRAAGCSVTSLARIGEGCPDLLCGKNGKTALIECKSPGGRLTPDQLRWHAGWQGGTLAVVFDVEGALRVAKLMESECGNP